MEVGTAIHRSNSQERPLPIITRRNRLTVFSLSLSLSLSLSFFFLKRTLRRTRTKATLTRSLHRPRRPRRRRTTPPRRRRRPWRLWPRRTPSIRFQTSNPNLHRSVTELYRIFQSLGSNLPYHHVQNHIFFYVTRSKSDDVQRVEPIFKKNYHRPL